MNSVQGGKSSTVFNVLILLLSGFVAWILIGLFASEDHSSGTPETEARRAALAADRASNNRAQAIPRIWREEFNGGGEDNSGSVKLVFEGAEALKRTSEEFTSSSSERNGVFFNFLGNYSIPTDEILDSLTFPEGLFGEDLDRTIRDQVRKYYRSKGFASVTVKVSSVGSDPAVVTVEISEGKTFTLDRLEIEGLESAAYLDARSLYPEEGETVNLSRIRQADYQLERAFRDAGFLSATVKGRAAVTGGDHFSYKVLVTEGSRYRVGALEIPTGLQSSFPFRRGQVFQPKVLEDYLQAAGISKSFLIVDEYPDRGEVEITIYE